MRGHPTALGLRNQGASKEATTAFMISTPQTGVDSLLVSASFLGWPFALFKLVAALCDGYDRRHLGQSFCCA